MDELSVQEVCSWFEANKDKNIMVKKVDQEDLDQIEINVHDVGFTSFLDTLDAYLPPKVIVLRGSGSIETHDGKKQRLPEDSYEIPFDERFLVIQNEKGMEIQTDRASYMITTRYPQS